jgi:DNA-directed RNA polymerase subunit N (RpoN/RPB10)
MEENKVEQTTQTQEQVEQPEVQETPPPERAFKTQEEVNHFVETRLAKERKSVLNKLGVDNLDVAIQSVKTQKELEEKQKIQKGEFEEIIKTKTQEWQKEKAQLESQLKDIKINKALLASASKNKAINPEQVVELLKSHIQLNESGNAEILDSKGIARYNNKGELFSTDDLVEEFLTQNPHFVSATPGGSGTKSNVDRNDSRTPFKLEDLDMNNPEHRKQYAEYRRRRDSKPTVINLNK